ncbi:LysR family transcriptional regulator [Microbulbifer sp. A4B17]|uniref:LysR family transcriptional regulator n=1 Tax=Microbulbifer sp. A4B17 TaxID=359370 RepID=UPI000D52B9B3|nr:LysR family transcriptional regulator [Microbulbifer sp. A4B17]AWF80284.1 LysR family transcriptional regulator [Microbulbifer sp. A4B17]
MYNLEQLRMFVEAVDTGSFSASARKLGKAQSAISQGIANLEIDLGVELFDRSTRKPTLTAAGQRLFGYAKVVLEQTEELNTVAQSIIKQEETAVRLAIEHALNLPTLGQILLEFRQRFPATEVELLSVASPDIIQLVDDGRVDIGLMFSNMAYKREVDVCFAGNITVQAVCSTTHPLTKLDSVEISHLAAHTQFILRGVNGDGLDHEVHVSSMIWTSNSIPSMLELIKQGIGWAYLPSHLIEKPVNLGELYKLPMRLDDKPWTTPVDRVTQKNQAMGPAVKWLSDVLIKLLD